MSAPDTGQMAIEFNKNGIEIKEFRAPLLGSGDPEWVTIEEHGWDELPAENLNMSVKAIKPEMIEDEGDGGLRSLVLRLSSLERSTPGEPHDETSFWELVETEIGITYDDGKITFAAEKTGKQNLKEFVELLVDRGYIGSTDLPVESGHKRYVLNTEPEHKEGDDMVNPEQLAPDIHLETHYSDEMKKKLMNRIVDRFVN
ncbi:type I restriction endonuclease subunit R [Halobacteriales archaeon QS_8_69_26]|nr:MAG: type I restriction endonuclease subunit R [Halobacteriales archaeon QS_8_69_26]